MVAKNEVILVYGEEYRDDGMSLRFKEAAFERSLMLGLDLRGIPSVVAQCCIMCDDECEELGLRKPGDENE